MKKAVSGGYEVASRIDYHRHLTGLPPASQRGEMFTAGASSAARAVIRSFSFDAATRELQMTFLSGRRYVDADVPSQLVAKFRDAPSRGDFFNANIRDRFAYREPGGVRR